MPGTVLGIEEGRIEEGRRCQFSVLSLALPGKKSLAIGVFLLDPADGELRFQLRDDWVEIAADEEIREYLSVLEEDFAIQIHERGGPAFLASLEDSLSNLLRISDRETVAVTNPASALRRLYQTHVDARIRRFVTHLPLYSLRAAATRFGEDAEVEETDWLPAPEGLRLTEGMFAARVVGRSMEPLIPDGSLCIFRAPVVGSRSGKRLLIEERGATRSGASFTVKRYTSRKAVSGDEWRHEAIRLEPLNPEFDAFDLTPEEFESRYRVIAEFVQTMEE
jgi:phage repressor protein C with HTH and peptisase S24 domain